MPHLGPRSVVPLLVGLVVGVLAATVLLPPAPGVTTVGPADASAGPRPEPEPVAPGAVRLPPCGLAVEAMAPRARLAQRLMVGVDAGDPSGAVEMVQDAQVGGIFLGGNATRLLRGRALRAVAAVARVPVAVAVDDEGGRVQRIDDLDGELPSARRMARRSSEQVRELGRARGVALRDRGVTMNLAPTVDLGGQPAGAVIGDRAFSTDPDVVSRYAGAFATGLRDAGVFPVLKHFPGHGRADGDSHRGRVTTPPLAQLRGADLRPYTDLLGDGATGVMVGHLDVPGLTEGLPSSLTPQVYALLRDDYGFDGLVLTDDLGAMKAVTGTFALPAAVLRALDAGADMALWSSGGPVSPVLDGLERALSDGRLDPVANDRAVARVLAAKGVCV
ncbi:MAG: glycoside hydrolase family 3 N-terminal domain-containing protein [Pseudonocardia sp.]